MRLVVSSLGVLFALFALPSSASADFSAATCTTASRGAVQPITLGEHCQGFRANAKEVRFARIASGTLVASQDARTVVMIEDYLPGRRTKAGIEALYDLDTVVNPTVVHVYRDGIRVAAYDVARLVKDPAKVRTSISHVQWAASFPTAITGSTFEIVTTTNRRITFDAKTGTIVAEADIPKKR